MTSAAPAEAQADGKADNLAPARLVRETLPARSSDKAGGARSPAAGRWTGPSTTTRSWPRSRPPARRCWRGRSPPGSPLVLAHLPDGSYLSRLDGLDVRIVEAEIAMTGADGTRIADSCRLLPGHKGQPKARAALEFVGVVFDA